MSSNETVFIQDSVDFANWATEWCSSYSPNEPLPKLHEVSWSDVLLNLALYITRPDLPISYDKDMLTRKFQSSLGLLDFTGQLQYLEHILYKLNKESVLFHKAYNSINGNCNVKFDKIQELDKYRIDGYVLNETGTALLEECPLLKDFSNFQTVFVTDNYLELQELVINVNKAIPFQEYNIFIKYYSYATRNDGTKVILVANPAHYNILSVLTLQTNYEVEFLQSSHIISLFSGIQNLLPEPTTLPNELQRTLLECVYAEITSNKKLKNYAVSREYFSLFPTDFSTLSVGKISLRHSEGLPKFTLSGFPSAQKYNESNKFTLKASPIIGKSKELYDMYKTGGTLIDIRY